MIIYLCPFCGRSLQKAIEYGITTCDNCHRVFDSSDYNKLLSVAWTARREHIIDSDYLQARCQLTDEETAFITKYIIDEEYTHDEFLSVMNARFSVKVSA